MFIAFASPMAFKTVRGILGGWVASPEGQAKFLGLLAHGILFVITVGFLMRRVSPYGWSHYMNDDYMDTKEGSSPMKEHSFSLTGSAY